MSFHIEWMVGPRLQHRLPGSRDINSMIFSLSVLYVPVTAFLVIKDVLQLEILASPDRKLSGRV